VDDQTRWLKAAAEILNAPDPCRAHELLVAALQTQTNAGLVSRVTLSPHDPDHVSMTVDGFLPYPPPEFWPGAEQVRGHPITRFHDDTRDFAPILMPDVIRAGWDLDGQSKEIMAGLGITEQQLSIPAAPNPAAYDGWVLIAEDAFDDDAATRLEPVQDLIIGLSLHICLLEQAQARRGQAPCPDAIPLTPREHVILCLVHKGHTVAGMAQRLGISPRTVHKHQENLYRKLGAVDRLSAVLAAQRLGIVPQDPEPLTPVPPRSLV
jgi:DNA-binding CsgD family transcriptional regulator